MRITGIAIGLIIGLILAVGNGFAKEYSLPETHSDSSSLVTQDSLRIQKQADNLKHLQADLLSGKPTLAFFYYSVACSCTAARCAIATAAIDSIPVLQAGSDSINIERIDAFLMPEAESLYNLMIMPAVVYYNNDGKEINRLEWGTSRAAITRLIEHPDEKQEPID